MNECVILSLGCVAATGEVDEVYSFFSLTNAVKYPSCNIRLIMGIVFAKQVVLRGWRATVHPVALVYYVEKDELLPLVHSSSCCMKGFAISSLPSTGEMTTSRVPRATMRPSLR